MMLLILMIINDSYKKDNNKDIMNDKNKDFIEDNQDNIYNAGLRCAS